MNLEIIVDGEYKLKLEVDALNVNELKEKLSAFKMLCSKLKHADLIVATELIRERPKLIPVIKEIMQDAEGKNKVALTFAAPVYIGKVMRVINGE